MAKLTTRRHCLLLSALLLLAKSAQLLWEAKPFGKQKEREGGKVRVNPPKRLAAHTTAAMVQTTRGWLVSKRIGAYLNL